MATVPKRPTGHNGTKSHKKDPGSAGSPISIRTSSTMSSSTVSIRTNPNGEGVNGTPYKVIAITPDMLRDGYVVTEYGKCKFNGMSFMCIDFDGKKPPRQ